MVHRLRAKAAQTPHTALTKMLVNGTACAPFGPAGIDLEGHFKHTRGLRQLGTLHEKHGKICVGLEVLRVVAERLRTRTGVRAPQAFNAKCT